MMSCLANYSFGTLNLTQTKWTKFEKGVSVKTSASVAIILCYCFSQYHSLTDPTPFMTLR